MPPARLVMADGAQIQLANKPEYLMGREDPVSGSFPDVDLEPHGAQSGGVSRKHAKILAGTGYSLVDLDSVNGTFLNKQKLAPNQPMQLNNGDEIRLGKLVMTFHTN